MRKRGTNTFQYMSAAGKTKGQMVDYEKYERDPSLSCLTADRAGALQRVGAVAAWDAERQWSRGMPLSINIARTMENSIHREPSAMLFRLGCSATMLVSMEGGVLLKQCSHIALPINSFAPSL